MALFDHHEVIQMLYGQDLPERVRPNRCCSQVAVASNAASASVRAQAETVGPSIGLTGRPNRHQRAVILNSGQ